MNPLRIFNFKRNASNSATSHNFVGAPSFRDQNPGYSMLNLYHSDGYDSAYPSIRAIANEYMTIMPFAIDKDSKRVDNNNIINALYHPNQTDSSVSFFEKIAVSTLFHRKTYVLVWRNEGGVAKPGGDFGFKGANIAGFTFLEFPGITRREGKTFYNVGSQEFNENEVMVLPGGVHPNNLYGGYAPSIASCKWGQLDDYIADFQSGFFENNAIPAGTFIVTAPTAKEYNDIVDKLQDRHRGAGKNNNVTYTHRPTDPTSGKPAEAQITWVPYSQSNKDIDFKNLFEQVNKRIDLAYGVPQIVKGVDDAATYANAQVAEAGFAKRAVKPLALRNYTQITHELNRMTGGMGIAITFDYQIPAVADEELVRAQTKAIDLGTVRLLVADGYSLDSVVDALELPASYKTLVMGTGGGDGDDDATDVDEGGEVAGSPDPDQIDGVTPLNTAKNASEIIKAAKAKVSEAANAPRPKAELSDADVEQYEESLAIVVRDNMSKQIEKQIDKLDAQNAEADPTEEETEDFTAEMMVVIAAVMNAAGDVQHTDGLTLIIEAGFSTDDITPYNPTDDELALYKKYLKGVADSYGEDTATSIRNVLARAQVEGWDRNRLETELRGVMKTDEWRVKRLATSEVNRSQDLGSINSMRKIQDESGATIERSLLHTGSEAPCEYCRAYIDNWQIIDSAMIAKNSVIQGADGGTMVYTWDTNDGHDVHANGHCVPQFRVRKKA